MAETNPLITIITPSYNQGHFLEETILSVMSQTYPHYEHLVIDGGSTDNSLDILRQYEGRYAMRWISERDEGQADAINKGYRMARGDLIGWINSDDTLVAPDAFTHLADAYRRHPHGRFFYGDYQITDEHSRVRMVCRQPGYRLQTLLEGTSLAQPGFFIHRTALEDVGYLNPQLHYALDWSFTVRLFTHYPPEKMIYIPEPLAATREYGDTKSRTGGRRAPTERRAFLLTYFARTDLPAEVRRLKRQALMATFWREAYLEWHVGHPLAALTAVFIALGLDPASLITRLPSRLLRMVWRRLYGVT